MDKDRNTDNRKFQDGEYVIYGNGGLCQIEGIASLDLTHSSKQRSYYILHPLNDNGMTLYTPTDHEEKMNRLLSREEAEEIVRNIPKIQPLTITKEKGTEEIYKGYIRSFDRVKWVQLIKGIYNRRQERIRQGKKTIAADEKYMKQAEEMFYSELSLVLEIPKNEIVDYISRQAEEA